MPNFSFSTANNFLRFTPETLDGITKRIAEKKAKKAQAFEEGTGEQEEEENIRPQLDLKIFKKLPALYGKPPPWLIGEPLEDVDPYYKDRKSFMVLSGRNRIFRFTATKALFLFSPFHPLRRLAIKILVHLLFMAFITCVVLVNCMLMTLNKLPEDYDKIEKAFTAVYTVEFVIKVVARGFILNRFTYLRDPWNILDLFVLIISYVAMCTSLDSISALRVFRVLRSLKAVSVIPGLKVIIASLLQSVKKLSNVMLLTIFCLAIFALVGLQLLMGNLKQKCTRISAFNESCMLNMSCMNPERYLHMNWTKNPLLCGFTSTPNITECKNGYYCVKDGDNPNHGYTSFDNFGWAFLSLFRLLTLDSWEVLYRQVIRTSGKSYVIFFVIIIFLCSFYLFNLILAVVIMAYEEQHKAALAQTKAREMLLQKAKEILKKEQELSAKRYIDENMKISDEKSKTEKKRESKWRKTYKEMKTKIYGEDETMFYSQPDKSQKELKDVLMSYRLPVDTVNDPFQRQKLTSAANVLSKTMEWEESKLRVPPGLKDAAKKYLIWQCCPLWLQIKEMVKRVIINPYTELFITLCIIVNTLLMALEHIAFTEDNVRIGNQVFTGIFTAEMILKLIALDPYYYFQRPWNIFDFIVVVIGIINLGVESRLSVLRMLRIFKLSKFWPALNKLMKIMMKSVGQLGNLTLVLMFTIFIFAVVGKQSFGSCFNQINQTSHNCTKQQSRNSTNKTHKLRWHMGDFLHSFLIVFRILCGEWIETMWDCMQAVGEGWCIFLFMLVLVLGNLVVLNLFIALLLSSFSSSAPETEADVQDPTFQIIFAHICRGLQFVKHLLLDLCCNAFKQKHKKASTKNKTVRITIQKDCPTEPIEKSQENCVSNEFFRNWKKTPVNGKQEHFMANSNTTVCVPLAETESLSDEEEHAVTEMDYNKQENQVRYRREQNRRSRRLSSLISESTSVWSLDVPRVQRSDHDTSGSEASTVDQLSPAYCLPEKKKEPEDCFPRALVKLFPCCTMNTDKFPGSTWWKIRKTCYKIIKHSWFESFIIFMILLSSFTLTFEDIYLEHDKALQILLDYADRFFFYTFFLEMLLKWVAYGFKKYFTSNWCLLDFFIVCVSSVSLLSTKSTQLCGTRTSIKSLRTLRALRPLRVLSRFPGIKVVVNALIGAIPSIGNVLLVCVVLWLPFSILGVHLFRGKFGTTVNATATAEHICGNKTTPWKPKSVSFDHVGMGYLALLQVATFKGWMEIMYAAVDAPERRCEEPDFENNVYAYLFFVCFITFGSFFMLNLFIGVVIDNFNQQRKKISGELIFLSDEQKKYYNALKKLGTKKPHKPIPRPLNEYQGFLFDIVNRKAFDLFIISLIFLNVVVMAVEHEGQETEAKNLLNSINQVFVAIFTAECVIKILALRLYFFKDNWNIFDLVVAILSVLSAAVVSLPAGFPPTILRIVRVVRISRLLRVIRGAQGIRTLLFALLMSLPALANIGLLLFLIMFIYAIFGMTNFACANWAGGIDNIFNFQTFGSSMLCLFQITTSAGWHDFLNPMLDAENVSCAPNLNISPAALGGSCVDQGMAIAYFVSYIIISFLIVVNMYIAVIIENLNVATEESTEPLGDDDFEIFYEIWAKFDPQATQFIAYSALSDFADSLEEPLRIPKPNKQQLIAMDLPMVNGNKIHCLDILLAFTKRVLGEAGEMGSFESQIEEKYPAKISYEPIVTTPKRKQDESAVIIQRAFRMHLIQRAIQEACHETCGSSPLENIPEEEGASAFWLNENEESWLVGPESPSSVSIPPSYSCATGTINDIPQVTITDNSNDVK